MRLDKDHPLSFQFRVTVNIDWHINASTFTFDFMEVKQVSSFAWSFNMFLYIKRIRLYPCAL